MPPRAARLGLTGMRYPEMVEPGAPLSDTAFVLPGDAMADVAKR